MNNTPRILILLPFFTLGGAEKQALILADYFHQHYDTSVWAIDKDGPLRLELKKRGIKHRLLDKPFSVFHSRVKRIKFYLEFLLMVRRGNFSHIFPYTYHCNVLCSSIWRFTKVKRCYWTQRAMEFHIPLSNFERLAKMMKPIYLANSKAAAGFIENRHQLRKNSVTIIPNTYLPVKPKKTERKWQEKLGVNNCDILLVKVANFYPEKDHTTVLLGFSQLIPEYPNLKLILPGYSSASGILDRIKALAWDLKLSGNVVFLGSISDITGLLQIADIGILSSKSEGCPNIILEYIGANLPIIATDIPAISEILGNDYPYLFELGNVEAFVTKLRCVILSKKMKNEKMNYDFQKRKFFAPNNSLNLFKALLQ